MRPWSRGLEPVFEARVSRLKMKPLVTGSHQGEKVWWKGRAAEWVVMAHGDQNLSGDGPVQPIRGIHLWCRGRPSRGNAESGPLPQSANFNKTPGDQRTQL